MDHELASPFNLIPIAREFATTRPREIIVPMCSSGRNDEISFEIGRSNKRGEGGERRTRVLCAEDTVVLL